jgi:flavin reductase (DIM6/NTAB) family NADH-FMN oxidoreductase RutF
VSGEALAAPDRPGRSADPAPLDAWSYRSIFRGHPAGVGVVTADDGRGPVGLTVSSIVSLSLTPPLVSFAIGDRSTVLSTFSGAGRAVIHFLDEREAELARRFAAVGVERFSTSVGWTRLPCGSPVLTEPPAYVAGSIVHQVPAGDHRLLIMQLDRSELRRPYAPMIYLGGRYGAAVPAAS